MRLKMAIRLLLSAGEGVQNGRAEVNTAQIANAGEFEDTMTFTISYAD